MMNYGKNVAGSTAKMISLGVRTLIESDCPSRCDLFLVGDDELCDGDYGSEEEGTDGNTSLSPLRRILNSVKLSLALTRAFHVKSCSNCKHSNNTNYDPSSLLLDDLVVTLRQAPAANCDNEVGGDDGEWSSVPDLSMISSIEDFGALILEGGHRWIILGITMDNNAIKNENLINTVFDDKVDESYAAMKGDMAAAAHLTTAIGKLLYHMFLLKPFPRLEEVESSTLECKEEDERGGIEEAVAAAAQPRSKRRGASESLFQRLIESGDCPISICRLLNDSINSSNGMDSDCTHTITSLDDIVLDLSQMISSPRLFLHDPERDFSQAAVHFGQRFNGRKRELSELLNITTVPHDENSGLQTIFVSGE